MANHSYQRYSGEYLRLWKTMVVTRAGPAKAQAEQIIKNKERYLQIERLTGVKWFVVGVLHIREAGSPPNFRAVLHNGEAIIGTGKKTRLVPANRGPFSSFETAAYDALVTLKGLDKVKWSSTTGPAQVAWISESFNGFGYRNKGIRSPYLWGGTNHQERGKYVRDRVFDRTVMDPQIGSMAVLKLVFDLDKTASWGNEGEIAPKPIPLPMDSKTKGTVIAGGTAATTTGVTKASGWFFEFMHTYQFELIAVGVFVAILLFLYFMTDNTPTTYKAMESDDDMNVTQKKVTKKARTKKVNKSKRSK